MSQFLMLTWTSQDSGYNAVSEGLRFCTSDQLSGAVTLLWTSVWVRGVPASLAVMWGNANFESQRHQIRSLLEEGKHVWITLRTPWSGRVVNREFPPQGDLLGRNVAVSMRSLRAPGLAFESRCGCGNFALIVFSTAVHAFIWAEWAGRKERN